MRGSNNDVGLAAQSSFARLVSSRVCERALRARLLDWAYWLIVTPFVTATLTRLATLASIAAFATVVPRPMLGMAFVIELPLALIVADVVGYWSHRMRHLPVLWHFHAIHHSPTRLDALAGARMHPLDDVIDNTLVGAALFAIGFSPLAIFWIGPILFAHLALIHANVGWTFGPLRFVFVSPTHHRAHHEIGARRNFAGMFAFVDIAFGTYAVGGERPHGSGEVIPESLRAHMTWPFGRIAACLHGDR